MVTEEQIVDYIWNREEKGLRELEEKYENYCYTVSYTVLKNEQDAKECVNDTWLGVWNSIPPKRPNCLKGYIATITRNISLKRYEKNHAKKRENEAFITPYEELSEGITAGNFFEEYMDEIVVKNAIEEYLSQVNKRKRIAFMQRYFYMMEYEEIGEVLGMRATSVRSMLSRMRKDLQQVLIKEGVHVG